MLNEWAKQRLSKRKRESDSSTSFSTIRQTSSTAAAGKYIITLIVARRTITTVAPMPTFLNADSPFPWELPLPKARMYVRLIVRTSPASLPPLRLLWYLRQRPEKELCNAGTSKGSLAVSFSCRRFDSLWSQLVLWVTAASGSCGSERGSGDFGEFCSHVVLHTSMLKVHA